MKGKREGRGFKKKEKKKRKRERIREGRRKSTKYSNAFFSVSSHVGGRSKLFPGRGKRRTR